MINNQTRTPITVDDVGVLTAGRTSCRSRSGEKAFRGLAEMVVTEACLSGLCDICLYHGTGLCSIFAQDWGDSHPSRRPR